MHEKEISFYVHYPFCISKCPYCDFNSHVAKYNVNDEQWIKAYTKELKYYKILSNYDDRKFSVRSIFFGGGTPSLMSPRLVEAVINLFNPDKTTEITLETNPSSFESVKFESFKTAGINRISIGVQALNETDLKVLGRAHNVTEANYAICEADRIFSNYSIDLIYARHNQSLTDWESELRYALKNLAKYHISLYSLTIEKGTKYFKMHQNGEITIPDNDKSYEFYKLTNDITKDFGFNLYEISNYAKNNYECLHNISYWSSVDYIGLGPGAHSRITNSNKQRTACNNIYDPKKWLEAIETQDHAIQKQESLSPTDNLYEILSMNLRYAGGINAQDIRNKFNIELNDDLTLNYTKLQHLLSEGLITQSINNISLTDKGRYVLDGILRYLV